MHGRYSQLNFKKIVCVVKYTTYAPSDYLVLRQLVREAIISLLG